MTLNIMTLIVMSLSIMTLRITIKMLHLAYAALNTRTHSKMTLNNNRIF
jgi:hypothetical protein